MFTDAQLNNLLERLDRWPNEMTAVLNGTEVRELLERLEAAEAVVRDDQELDNWPTDDIQGFTEAYQARAAHIDTWNEIRGAVPAEVPAVTGAVESVAHILETQRPPNALEQYGQKQDTQTQRSPFA